MSGVGRALHAVLHAVERAVDAARRRRRSRRGYGPLRVMAYRGHGTARELHVRGRVLAERPTRPPSESDTPWDNLRRMLRRFRSREVPGAEVRLAALGGDVEARVACDGEGYFHFSIVTPRPPPAPDGWTPAELEVTAAPGRGILPARGTAQVRIPDLAATVGVVTDVDDTILETGATDLFRMLRVTLLQNALTRLPFEGAAAFYRALEAGADGSARNPFFYVSSTPWNLYDFLVAFLDHRGFPRGPLFLRDLGIDETKFVKGPHARHKRAAIEEVLRVHAGLPFVLVGDSGQHDPEIYARVARDHPGRVRAIYIRDSGLPERAREVERLARELAAERVQMVLSADTRGAARHAAERGLIAPGALPSVAAGAEADAAAPGDVAALAREVMGKGTNGS